jgi:NAD(P)-binding Rossmann-like domain/Flavin containing amine oxidoreductase
MNASPRVTIAGGGLAGLTAAFRLAERGYRVKLYEQKPMLGGNLASRPAAGGRRLDIYPHMYGNWYHNFWRLLGDVTELGREQLFLPMSSVKQLRRNEFPRFTGPTDMYSGRYLLQNLFSGMGPVPDMFVFGYSQVDLLAERTCPTMLPDDLTVGGFLNARPYMTKRAADAVDTFITLVWAVPSYLVSADDYRTYLDYCVADPIPGFWLARGSAFDQVITRLTTALEEAGVEIVPSVQVTSVSCRNGRVAEIGLQNTRFDKSSGTWVGSQGRRTEEIDELVLAVPAPALSRLVRSGKSGRRIVEAAPRLAELSRLGTQAIPILHAYFTRKLRHIPQEPVGLFQSRLGLAFTDISQTWQDGFGGRTVLALSSSDPYGLPGTGNADDAMAMLRELAEYLEFEPGPAWGQSPDIDWTQTRYEPNADARLFVNQAGSDVWRPQTTCEELENLCFAGDFCQNRIGMTTIESAVTTGLEAAAAIVERRALGEPIEIRTPRSRPGVAYAWLRYAWGPYALAAKAWSEGVETLRRVGRHLLDS